MLLLNFSYLIKIFLKISFIYYLVITKNPSSSTSTAVLHYTLVNDNCSLVKELRHRNKEVQFDNLFQLKKLQTPFNTDTFLLIMIDYWYYQIKPI